eukprot:gene42831-56931_t
MRADALRGGASAVAGGAFVDEGIDALTRVGVVQVANEVVALGAQLRVQQHRGCVVGQFLDAGERIGRACIEPFAQGERVRECLTGGAHGVDHAQLLQTLGAHAVATHEQLQGGGAGQGAQQASAAGTTGERKWQIQIAAATSAQAAMDLLSDARDKVGAPLQNLDTYTEMVTRNGTTFYRARFTGFETRDEARTACDKLVRQRYDCVLVAGVELERNVPGAVAARHLGAATWVGQEAQDVRYAWPHMFHLVGQEYERRYGMKYEHLGRIAEINLTNARRNPKAQTRSW